MVSLNKREQLFTEFHSACVYWSISNTNLLKRIQENIAKFHLWDRTAAGVYRLWIGELYYNIIQPEKRKKEKQQPAQLLSSRRLDNAVAAQLYKRWPEAVVNVWFLGYFAPMTHSVTHVKRNKFCSPGTYIAHESCVFIVNF